MSANRLCQLEDHSRVSFITILSDRDSEPMLNMFPAQRETVCIDHCCNYFINELIYDAITISFLRRVFLSVLIDLLETHCSVYRKCCFVCCGIRSTMTYKRVGGARHGSEQLSVKSRIMRRVLVVINCYRVHSRLLPARCRIAIIKWI